MSSSDRERRNVRLLLTARGVRAFGDGCVSILVPVYLTGMGFGAFEVGALTTAMLLGPAMLTLVIGLIAHRLETVRLLTTTTTLMVLSGIGYAFETEFWPLLVIALVGTLSPTASDVSVFAPLEQTLLSNAVVPQRRTSIFATYSLIGSVLSAIGCLFASAPEIVARAGLIPPDRALQGMFLIYAFLGAIAFMIYRQLKSPMEATVSEPAIGPLGPSRRIVFTLAALFSLDSFGGGFFVQSLLALWLFDHFGLSLTAAGALFFWSGLLSAFSYPVAVRLARRIGLVNTMVFTHLPSNACLMLVPFAPTLGIAGETQTERTFAGLMKDAQLLIQKPSLLQKAIEMIDALPLTSGDRKGDVYEYLLSKLTTAGINGQFRTPRHIIDLMVAMLDPQPSQTVADPACGTGGFLIRTVDYLLKAHTSPSGILREESDGELFETWTGDKLSDTDWHHIQTRMFNGFDFDATMLRLAAMNLMLHGVEDAGIRYQDTLGSGFTESERYDLVFANPPFKGSLDFEDTNKTLLAKVRTRKTELLFVTLILRLLKPGGRAAVIVPDGVLFGASTAHRTLRKHLIDDNQLEGVISLPSGVFKPYAGVSTAILAFTKGGRTEDIFFFDVRADGYSLDDKREPVIANDLPKALVAWKRWQDKGQWGDWERSGQGFLVPAEEIRNNAYDLSLSRYHEPNYQDEEHETPKVILGRIKKLEQEVQRDLAELERMLA